MTFSAKYSQDGTITAGPLADGQTWSGITPSSRFWAEVMKLTNNGAGIQPYAVPGPTTVDYQNAIQGKVDETAVTKQFNDGVSLASYKDSTIPLWAAQAHAFIAWRDQVWASVYTKMADVQAGHIPQPSVADVVASLPAIVWP